jgi:hypothetical protein
VKNSIFTYWRYLSVLLVPILGSGAGCAAVAVGAAGGSGLAYMIGDLETKVNATPKEVAAAAGRALEDLEIRLILENSSKLDAKVVGRTGTDRRVQITAEMVGEGGSEVFIRVGIFGDEHMSRQILDALKKQLD